MADLICYCFNYTTEDILKDLDENGRSLIMEKILEEKWQSPSGISRSNCFSAKKRARLGCNLLKLQHARVS